MITKKELWLTEDRKTILNKDDENAVYLLAGKGQELPDELADLYDLAPRGHKKKTEEELNNG